MSCQIYATRLGIFLKKNSGAVTQTQGSWVSKQVFPPLYYADPKLILVTHVHHDPRIYFPSVRIDQTQSKLSNAVPIGRCSLFLKAFQGTKHFTIKLQPSQLTNKPTFYYYLSMENSLYQDSNSDAMSSIYFPSSVHYTPTSFCSNNQIIDIYSTLHQN